MTSIISAGVPRIFNGISNHVGGARGTRWIEWLYHAPRSGRYILEVRYTLGNQGSFPCKVTINGKNAGEIVLWTTGKSCWVWARKAVTLIKGKNTIRLQPGGAPLIDHLNVLYAGS